MQIGSYLPGAAQMLPQLLLVDQMLLQHVVSMSRLILLLRL
jgi:hypothetical protein